MDMVSGGVRRIELSVESVLDVRVETSVVSGGEVEDKLVGSSEVSVRGSWRRSSESPFEPVSLGELAASRVSANVLWRKSRSRWKTAALCNNASSLVGEFGGLVGNG